MQALWLTYPMCLLQLSTISCCNAFFFSLQKFPSVSGLLVLHSIQNYFSCSNTTAVNTSLLLSCVSANYSFSFLSQGACTFGDHFLTLSCKVTSSNKQTTWDLRHGMSIRLPSGTRHQAPLCLVSCERSLLPPSSG